MMGGYDRKRLSAIALFGIWTFWLTGVLANHGLGRIKVQTPVVIIGEVGFLTFWLILAGVQVVTYIRHKPAARRLNQRHRRHIAIEKSRHKSFRLTPLRRPWDAENNPVFFAFFALSRYRFFSLRRREERERR
jgi:hypothetical protein